MLVEFSASNFRSIGEKITFSASAGTTSGKRTDLAMSTGNSLAPKILKSAVLLGPNGSGKSSIVKAMEFFQSFVSYSSKKLTAGDKIRFSQNVLISELSSEPSEFEIVFIHRDELFQYGFKLDNFRVHEEWLFARNSRHLSKTRTLFHREFKANTDNEYVWEINDSQVPGERNTWKEATRPNALFLSTAVQLNSESLRKPFEWIQEYLLVVGANERIDRDFTASLLENDKTRGQIEELFYALDLQLEGFRIESKPAAIPERMKELFSENLIQEITDGIKDTKEYDVFAKHKDSTGNLIEINLNLELDGTQAIFGLAGPIFDVLSNGYTLFVDELSNSLHPLALKCLVNIFHDEEMNKFGGQLFFTSHETSIISKNFMHKDQIWFVDRPDGLATTLRPLSDYAVREVEAFQRSYLGGKFGALPNVRRLQHVSEE